MYDLNKCGDVFMNGQIQYCEDVNSLHSNLESSQRNCWVEGYKHFRFLICINNLVFQRVEVTGTITSSIPISLCIHQHQMFILKTFVGFLL